MSKTEFTPEDFIFDNGLVDRQCHVSANQANKRLAEIKEAWKAEMLKDAVVVYGSSEKMLNSTVNKTVYDTHKAMIINIKPIVKECVKHEADLFGTRRNENSFPCIHCGVELVAEWKVKT